MATPRLPPELWVQVFEAAFLDPPYPAPRSGLAQFCRVSRQFDALARPLLYQEFRAWQEPIFPFVRTIAARPDLANHVTRLEFIRRDVPFHTFYRGTQESTWTWEEAAMLEATATKAGLKLDDSYLSGGFPFSNADPLSALLIALLPRLRHIESRYTGYGHLEALPQSSYLTQLRSIRVKWLKREQPAYKVSLAGETIRPLLRAPNLESVLICCDNPALRDIRFENLSKLQLANMTLSHSGPELGTVLGSCAKLETFLYSNDCFKITTFNKVASPRRLVATLLETPVASSLKHLAIERRHRHARYGILARYSGQEVIIKEPDKWAEETRCGVDGVITCLRGFKNLEVLYLEELCFWRGGGFEDPSRRISLLSRMLPRSIRQLFLDGWNWSAKDPSRQWISDALLELARAVSEGELPALMRVYCTGFSLERPEMILEAFRQAGVDFSPVASVEDNDELHCGLCWVRPFCSAFDHIEYANPPDRIFRYISGTDSEEAGGDENDDEADNVTPNV